MKYKLVLLGLFCALGAFVVVSPAMGANFVNGFVPDWNQPLAEGAGAPVPPGGWAAWCAPTSASNLAGHWDDVQGVAVADGTAFPGTTVAFAAGASWKDYLAVMQAAPLGFQEIMGEVNANRTMVVSWLHWNINNTGLTVQPNPEKEEIVIEVPYCTVVDQIVIDTRCVPEPATLALLGLGGLCLVRRRRS